MKKTLIALAAVAATGSVFAQSTVTLTGKFGAAYTANKTAAGAKSSGFGVTDGDVVFAATEDLGGGLKAGASLALKLRGRDGVPTATSTAGTTALSGVASSTVGGRDASVFLSGGFGTLTMGAVEAGNGIIGLASAGAPVIGQDNGTTLDGGVNVDLFQYTSPELIPGLTARVVIIDSIGNPGADGLQAAAATQDASVVGLAYASGPVAVNADFTAFGQNATAATNNENRTRISGSYDFGMFKLGAGFQTRDTYANVNDKQYMFGVSMPMGAVTLGATYAKRNNDNNALDASGYEVGANYAFSKRTNLQTAFRSQKIVGASAATSFRVRLMHSF